jgi:hypothetical protein
LSRVSIRLIASVVLVVASRAQAGPPPDDPLALRVLVELRVDAALRERDPGRAIREAADRLERALGGAGIAYEIVRRYETIPWIALRIAPASRERVVALPEVAGLRDDRIDEALPQEGT